MYTRGTDWPAQWYCVSAQGGLAYPELYAHAGRPPNRSRDAAPFVSSYMETMRAAAEAYGGRDVSPTSPMYTNETVMAAASAMASAAAAATPHDEFRARVLRSSLSIDYMVLLRWNELYSFVTKVQKRPWPLASSKRQFFTAFAAASNGTVSDTIAVPTCPGWINGPGPSGHQCWHLQGNVTEFERFLFPPAHEPVKAHPAA